jgi:hypothetical protein
MGDWGFLKPHQHCRVTGGWGPTVAGLLHRRGRCDGVLVAAEEAKMWWWCIASSFDLLLSIGRGTIHWFGGRDWEEREREWDDRECEKSGGVGWWGEFMAHAWKQHGVSCSFTRRAGEASLCSLQALAPWKRPNQWYVLGLSLGCFDACETWLWGSPGIQSAHFWLPRACFGVVQPTDRALRCFNILSFCCTTPR